MIFKRFFIPILLIALIAPAFGDKIRRPTTRTEAVQNEDTLKLAFPSRKGPIPYEKFGRFENVGAAKYRYVISDMKGLSDAAGEGIFPYARLTQDPTYKELLKLKSLDGSHWNYVDNNTAALNFYKWASTSEDPGIKQFFTALMLERAGLIEEAVKAFYAMVVHFPKTSSQTYYETAWFLAPAALDRVEQLLRRHPSIRMSLEGGRVMIKKKFDRIQGNDAFSIDPGRLVGKRFVEKPVNLAKLKVIKTIGGPHVQLRQYENRHWKLFVEDKPFQIRALTYSICPVGRSPDRRNWDVSKDWQLLDTNKNGLHDGFFESFIDKNENNRQDPDEPTVGDAKILKDLGVNTLRAYHHLYNKDLFRKLHKEYGFQVLCGDVLGGYAVGSGATWADGTDYNNPKQQKAMLEGVRKMVEEYKDEPYILMWVLGNENVYGVGSNAGKDPKAFYKFVDKAAELIHRLDPTRPVAIANGDLLGLDLIQEYCPNIDVFGANAYRGEQGFGRHFFQEVRETLDKPVLISEYGDCAYAENFTQKQAEDYQAMYLANNWDDMEAHMAGRGVGNALGGVLFEFLDEWWKANSDLPLKVQKERADWYKPKSAIYKNLQPDKQDTVPQFGLPFLDGWSYEEWFGLASQGNGQGSPFVRILRPAFFTMQEIWRSKEQ